MRIRSLSLWSCAALVALPLAASVAQAQTPTPFVAYDNLSTLSSLGSQYLFPYLNANATVVGSNIITALIADDIKAADVTSPFHLKTFSFYVTNTNNVAVTVRPLLRIWDDDRLLEAESTDVPGTLFGAYTLPSVTLPAAPAGSFSSSLINFNFPSNGLNITSVPNQGRPDGFYAGLVFDNANGRTGATLEQMNGIGLLINDLANDGSVIKGASGNVVYKTNTDTTEPNNPYFAIPEPNAFAENDPPGYIANFYGENHDPLAPYTNTAMRFTAVNGLAVPEPGTWGLLLTGILPGAVPVLRRRKD